MSGYQTNRVTGLFQGARFVGVRQFDGTEMLLAGISSDGLSLTGPDGSMFTPLSPPDVQKVTPASGDTVQMTDSGYNGTLYIAATATLAALTIALPTETHSRIGQIRRIASKVAVNSVTITGAIMLSTIGSLAAGDCPQFVKIDVNTWTRII